MYVNFDGVIDFKTKEAFDKFVKSATDKGLYDPDTDSWVNDNGPIRPEADDPNDVPPTLLAGDGIYAVILPDYPIDGMSGLIAELEDGTWEGELRGTTDDGEFEGYIVTPDGKWETIDLEAWAKEHGHKLTRTEDDEDWVTDERIDVMESFIENPHPPKNSTKFMVNE